MARPDQLPAGCDRRHRLDYYDRLGRQLTIRKLKMRAMRRLVALAVFSGGVYLAWPLLTFRTHLSFGAYCGIGLMMGAMKVLERINSTPISTSGS